MFNLNSDNEFIFVLLYSLITGITTATRGKLIQWESESGLRNRGRVVFNPLTTEKDCSTVKLAIEFDLPRAIASAVSTDFVGRFVQDTLLSDLKRFRASVLRYKRQQRMLRNQENAA